MANQLGTTEKAKPPVWGRTKNLIRDADDCQGDFYCCVNARETIAMRSLRQLNRLHYLSS